MVYFIILAVVGSAIVVGKRVVSIDLAHIKSHFHLKSKLRRKRHFIPVLVNGPLSAFLNNLQRKTYYKYTIENNFIAK